MVINQEDSFFCLLNKIHGRHIHLRKPFSDDNWPSLSMVLVGFASGDRSETYRNIWLLFFKTPCSCGRL